MKKNRNYQILSNIKEFNINNDMFLNVKKINSIKNINDKIINIFEFYNNIYLNNDKIQNLTISKTNKKNSKDIKACKS